MKQILMILLLICGSPLFSQTDYWACQVYFSGCPINHIPKGITIPDKDRTSRDIINSIINGSTYKQLLKQFPDSLDIRLEKLTTGKVIEKNQNNFRILFPVLVNKPRQELLQLIHKRLTESGFSADDIINVLKEKLSKNPEMIFHFLWSRIIDDCWWNLYNETFKTQSGPPSIAFIVYPPHPFQCGTNSDYSSGNDMFAMSWSYNLFNESFQIPSTKSFFTLAVNGSVPEKDRDFFLKHGLSDSLNHSTIFTYHQNDSIDRMCDSMKEVYIRKVKKLFNYSDLSRIFQIPADELFIIISHEIAYELIQEINAEKQILIPISKNDNPELNFKFLVSIRYNM